MAKHWKTAARMCAWALASALLAVTLGLAAAGPVEALGGASGQTAAPQCPAGQYFNQQCNECAKTCRSGYVWACGRGCVQRSGMTMPDEELYAQAVSLIGAEHYSDALELLWAIKVRQDPKVLNHIGFASRKLGHVDEGIKFYQKALALDPDYTPAREYLGEGYLQKGDVAAANRQLAEIKTRCGESCREYAVLARAIADHRTGKSSNKTSW